LAKLGCGVAVRELVLSSPGDWVDALSDALIEAGALSISVEDADLDTDDERPIFGEPGGEDAPGGWQHNRVVALLADGDDPQQILVHVEAELNIQIASDWFLRDVPDQDWVRLTQSQFGPIQIGDRVLILPSWHAGEAPINRPEGSIVIELDPGLAFGTGSHPTTHVCLSWLAHNMSPGVRVLDYGCGSGILAIASKMFGADHVDAVDIDEQAVLSTVHNAHANHTDVHAMLPDQLITGQYDVVVANILSNPLKVLAPMLSNRVKVGGYLVLSGVLARQAQEVAATYAPWLTMEVWAEREGWVCLAGQRAV
jgi:ribosomal protein L11 methyltransferase